MTAIPGKIVASKIRISRVLEKFRVRGKTRAARIHRKLGIPEASGAVLWEGPSLIDGAPIAVIMTYGSSNDKTGDIHQTWILRTDIDPVEGVREGTDESICGDCPHRPYLIREVKAAGLEPEATFYVNVGQAPLGIWKAYKRGRYPLIGLADAASVVAGDVVRFGAYGDPGAAPRHVWSALADAASEWTGYTHRWADTGADLTGLCMASVDNLSEKHEADAAGFATFRVVRSSNELGERERGEAICPASPTLTCLTCPIKCNGEVGKITGRVILDHGPGGEGRKKKAA